MKWWGEGHEDVAFTHEDKPDLRRSCSPTSRSTSTGCRHQGSHSGTCAFPSPACRPGSAPPLEAAVGAGHVSTDPFDRLVHAQGKSLRHLVRHRRGETGRLPDVVVRPGAEDAVTAVLRVAIDADAVVIPFGRRREHLGQPRTAGGRHPARRRSTCSGCLSAARSSGICSPPGLPASRPCTTSPPARRPDRDAGVGGQRDAVLLRHEEVPAQARRAHRRASRRPLHRQRPSVRPEEVRHAPTSAISSWIAARWPTYPRPPRRGASCPSSTTM